MPTVDLAAFPPGGAAPNTETKDAQRYWRPAPAFLRDLDCTAEQLREQLGDVEFDSLVVQQLYASMHTHDPESFPLDP